MKFSLYSVPGAGRENGLESRLQAILSVGHRLNPRVAAALATTALGVGLAVLAVRPTLLKTPPKPFADIVAQASETVTLPGGITVRMRGFWRPSKERVFTSDPKGGWQLNKKALMAQGPTWNLESKFAPIFPGVRQPLGVSSEMTTLVEVIIPAGVDAHISSGFMVANMADVDRHLNRNPKTQRQYFVIHPVKMSAWLEIGHGVWRTTAQFDAQGKRITGQSVTLRWSTGKVQLNSPLELIATNSWLLGSRLPDTDERLVATDRSGKDHVLSKSASSSTSPQLPHQIAYESSKQWPISKDKIVAYRYETRPWTRIRFEGWKAPRSSFMKNLYQPYSVPGAVAKNGLEVRLRSLLSRHSRLSPRGSAFLLTLALGVTLPVLAVRPHLIRDANELVKQAREAVTLPGGVRVRMLGFRNVDKDYQSQFWDTTGTPSESPYSKNERFGALPGLHSLIEIQLPAGSDASVRSNHLVSYLDGDDPKTARRHVAFNPVSEPVTVGVGYGKWRVMARFDAQGKRMAGEPVHLHWEGKGATWPNKAAEKGMAQFAKNTWISEDSLPDTDSRLVALDRDGKEYVLRSTASTPRPQHKVFYYEAKLWPISKDKIVAYRYETRPWTQIRFEGWKAPKGINP